MKTIVTILFLVTLTNSSVCCQNISYTDLTGGKWKYENLPDSIQWPDSTMHICPYNPTFWFKDSSKIDVVWNGFYFSDQKYIIDKKRKLIYVYIDSTYENVQGFACVFKPVANKIMKLQYCAYKKGILKWNPNETWYNTNPVYLFDYKNR